MRTNRRMTIAMWFAIAVSIAAGAAEVRAQGITRTLYATATESAGTPVLDMQAADFEVRDGGRVQEISARPATNPLRVALIVSDGGGGQFQQGALTFCEAVLGSGEIAITGVVVQPEPTSDIEIPTEDARGDMPPALAALVEERLAAQQAAVDAAIRASVVVLPPATWREIQERAASVGVTAELKGDGVHLQLSVDLGPAHDDEGTAS